MNSIKHNVWRFQQMALAVVLTVLITALLFAALPWLNHMADREQTKKTVKLALLTPRRPPKASESEKEKRLRMEELKLAPKPNSRLRTTTQQLNKPKFGFEFGQGGFGEGVVVSTINPREFGIDMEEFGFSLSQVDKAPRPIRRILPVYPFTAKKLGIKAKVKIKCLVDKNGMPQRIVAAECYPEDALDIFGPPAVEAVKKWRFRPGEIDGDPVPTRVAFNLIFELD